MYIADPNTSKLTSMHFYVWKCGLKIEDWYVFYLRTRPKVDTIKFTVDQDQLTRGRKAAAQDPPQQEENDEICLSWGAKINFSQASVVSCDFVSE